jgi:hypothetical protein
VFVDQFGYLPERTKIAVLIDPVTGFNAGDVYTPGALLELRRWVDSSTVLSAAPTAWNAGATQVQSGDRGSWFDFSSVTTPGDYYVYDAANDVRSPKVRIGDQVYRPVLKAAMRMFFYNRIGQAKQPPYADARWTDSIAFSQDSVARDVSDQTNVSKQRDLHGGWCDAGDCNKYVTFAASPVHQLLSAYEENPSIWTDDFDIPESSNGMPDILDELKWELDWLVRMQGPSGDVRIKMGNIDYNTSTPLSGDHRTRYYGPYCSSSTIAAAGMFAHAALVFDGAFAADLQTRAIAAYARYLAMTKSTTCDDGTIKSGDADWSLAKQEAERVVAAIYLYALTGTASYDTDAQAGYTQLRPYTGGDWSRYEPEQGESSLFYTTLAGANTTMRSAILNKKKSEADSYDALYRLAVNEDLYRSYMPDANYTWGSHMTRANTGNTNFEVLAYGIAASAGTAPFLAAAEGALHYMHGVNPFGTVYLTRMEDYGAERSMQLLYHQWFTTLPAPGYVPGGPNKDYSGTSMPPKGQPVQKAYRDWNGPEVSYEITEPGIYYQASYIRLLARFVR